MNSSTTLFNILRGRHIGDHKLVGSKPKTLLANRSTPSSSAASSIPSNPTMPGIVIVRSILRSRLVFVNFLAYFMFANHCCHFNPVRTYSPTSPAPSMLASILQCLNLLRISSKRFIPKKFILLMFELYLMLTLSW